MVQPVSEMGEGCEVIERWNFTSELAPSNHTSEAHGE
jgi:hypothetical protein